MVKFIHVNAYNSSLHEPDEDIYFVITNSLDEKESLEHLDTHNINDVFKNKISCFDNNSDINRSHIIFPDVVFYQPSVYDDATSLVKIVKWCDEHFYAIHSIDLVFGNTNEEDEDDEEEIF